MREATSRLQAVAVLDGLSPQHLTRVIPAATDTAAAAWESVAARPRTSRQEGVPTC
jgi:hypothetical protein